MLIIGLTGNLGTGKSTVAAMFARRGIKIIDADAITRDLLAPGKKCVKKVAKIFPGAILNKSSVNRSELAKIVFNIPCELQKLTDILYPEALKVVKSLISRYKHESFVVLDAPLLFESRWDKITDTTIVVKAKRAQQIERAQKRLRTTRSDVMRRLKNQMPLKEKCDMADMIIDNSHDLRQTQKQVDAIINRLRKRRN
jgi:dephospho-CoA kinase